jgi:hypothetical protein
MGKRFTDTNKYKKPFIRGLQGAYKLLWDFLYHDCDHAGIWIVDFEIAQSYIGKDMPIDHIQALKNFNDGEVRIIEIDNGKKWFIPSFIEFQYGQLTEKNRAHASVIQILLKHDLVDSSFKIKTNKLHTSPLQGGKDMDMDKDKEQDKEKEKEKEKEPQNFEILFSSAFDENTCEGYKLAFRGVDLSDQLQKFYTKCNNDKAKYYGRDVGGLRSAFQYQLQNLRSNGKRNGTTAPTESELDQAIRDEFNPA